jgi:hypothetical protein
MPSLGRNKWQNFGPDVEQNLYFDFVTQAGALLPESNSSWSNIFMMQHHGLPTRLLDWTENFAVALHFALANARKEAAIWILDPFSLNEITINTGTLIDPPELGHSYCEYYVDRTATLGGNVVAVSPLRHNPRVFQQRAGFTLHDNLKLPLEQLHPTVVTKLVLKSEGFADARAFLELAGVNEFTLFPDLDGLARELKRRHFSSVGMNLTIRCR